MKCKWEYYIIEDPTSLLMQEAGEQGWELAAVVYRGEDKSSRATFKRPIDPNSPPATEGKEAGRYVRNVAF